MVNGKKAKAMANQLATVDKSRLKSRIGSATHREMEGIEEAIKIQLGMD
jgi:mRNA-degrading endonuclease toxin of MazEF toxin-antitoxin module